MIVGFGFGPPLVSILMLLATLGLSYAIFRFSSRRRNNANPTRRREDMRQYYYERRAQARQMSRDYDLTDEEIEQKLNEVFGPEDD